MPTMAEKDREIDDFISFLVKCFASGSQEKHSRTPDFTTRGQKTLRNGANETYLSKGLTKVVCRLGARFKE